MAGCIFCSIARGDAPARYVFKDGEVVAIEDLNPVAPLHVLVMPVRHVDTARELTDAGLLSRVFEVAHQVAGERGVADRGYRLVFNVGPDGGQTVQHAHLHVIGGRSMTWPPG